MKMDGRRLGNIVLQRLNMVGSATLIEHWPSAQKNWTCQHMGPINGLKWIDNGRSWWWWWWWWWWWFPIIIVTCPLTMSIVDAYVTLISHWCSTLPPNLWGPTRQSFIVHFLTSNSPTNQQWRFDAFDPFIHSILSYIMQPRYWVFFCATFSLSLSHWVMCIGSNRFQVTRMEWSYIYSCTRHLVLDDGKEQNIKKNITCIQW